MRLTQTNIPTGIDYLRACPTCGELRHVSSYRVGRRGCVVCEVEEEFEKYARLKTLGLVEWRPDHGPKPLLTQEELAERKIQP